MGGSRGASRAKGIVRGHAGGAGMSSAAAQGGATGVDWVDWVDWVDGAIEVAGVRGMDV
jgi:hypothetical protein